MKQIRAESLDDRISQKVIVVRGDRAFTGGLGALYPDQVKEQDISNYIQRIRDPSQYFSVRLAQWYEPGSKFTFKAMDIPIEVGDQICFDDDGTGGILHKVVK